MPLSPASLLIVFALKAEARDHFDERQTLFCGVGKINAAYALTRALAAWERTRGQKPSLVLNAGSAGSSAFKAGTLVNCTRFVQRDMDATALAFPPFATPFCDTPVILENGLRLPSLPEGTCGTGDNFATSGTNGHWNVADMESFALAKVCHHENVPFCCLKHITDGADEHSPTAWETELENTALELRKVIDSVIIGQSQ